MKIVLPGNPIPKHRPRFTRSGRAYNDQRKEMEDLSFLVIAQLQDDPVKNNRKNNISGECKQHSFLPFTGPVKLAVTFYMPISKSLSKKKQQELDGTPHYKRPDLDNLIKIMDLLNCIVVVDDAIISEIHAYKKYSSNPRTEIEILSLDG